MPSSPWRSLTTRGGLIIGVIMAMIAAVAGLAMAPASAATAFNVNSTNDFPLANPNGTTCLDVLSTCSLRAATEAANNLNNTGGPVTINVPAGTYNLSSETALVVANRDNETISIVGALASTTIVNAIQPSTCATNTATCVQVFQLDTDGANTFFNNDVVTLSGLTVSGGKISGASSNLAALQGAGIESGNTGSVTTLANDVITNNQIVGADRAVPGAGVGDFAAT